MRKIHYIILLAAFAATSCDKIVYEDIPDCDYNVILQYEYNLENTSQQNQFNRYVKNFEEYIFDSRGVLCQINSVAADSYTPDGAYKRMLEPGQYSVIAIGNIDGRSVISDNGIKPKVGVTCREDLKMSLENAPQNDDGTKGPSERLYHGYHTFTVKEDQMSSIRVDMVHSHMNLFIRVVWRETAPVGERDVTMAVSDITSGYSLMPEFAYINFASKVHNLSTDDRYPTADNSVIHHIPLVREDIMPRDTYRIDSYINADRAVNVEFVSYRVRKSGNIMVTLSGSSGPLMNDVDLAQWFADNNIELDRNLRQEFALEFIIEPDGSVTVNALELSDWFEGGIIN